MSNNKQNRTDGVIHSSSMKISASTNPANTPTSEYSMGKNPQNIQNQNKIH